MKVRVSPEAEEEIYAIGRFVARDDRTAALRLIDQIWNRCDALADAPERSPVAGKIRGVVIRKLVHGPYLIVYSVQSGVVRVHRVAHGARDPNVLLKNIDPHA